MAHATPSARSHAVILVWAAFGILLALNAGETRAAPPDVADASWATVDLARAGGVSARLLVRKAAALSDEEWIAFEFTNGTKTPLRVTNGTYRLDNAERSLEDDGTAVSSSSLASGNQFNLFRGVARPGHDGGPAELALLPGDFRASRCPGAYSAALLGMPPHGGWVVRARAHLNVSFEDGTSLETPEAGVPPDLAKLRQRARALLREPEETVEDGYLLDGLLRLPAVADSLGSRDLLAALETISSLPS